MKTEIVTITELNNDAKEKLLNAASILSSGGLVVMPTETVYGLGGDATNADAAQKIYEAKGRPSNNPLIIHIAEPSEAEDYCHTSPLYYKLADAFMPGPLTVIMPKKDTVPKSVTGGLDTVAVRCPAHPVANALIRAFGKPIAAPSANISGRPSPTCAKYVIEDLDGHVDMIIDGGQCEIGLESTIVKIDGDTLTLLRPGAVTFDALTMVCEKVIIADAVTDKLKEGETVLSPGMMYRHYAPKTPVILIDGAEHRVIDYLLRERRRRNGKCAVICYDGEEKLLGDENVIPIGAKDDLVSHGKNIFNALREADTFGAQVIYAHMPKKEGLGLALYNRLIRAAEHTVLHITGE